MQEGIIPFGFRRQAARSRMMLCVVIGLTAVVILVAQWVDLAALLQISPGAPGLLLQSENANWADWVSECLAGPAILFAMARIAHMLRRLTIGDAFSTPVIADVRSFAFWILVATLISVLGPWLGRPIIHAIWQSQPSGSVQLSGSDLLLILVSAIFFQIARLLDAARNLADEYQQIV